MAWKTKINKPQTLDSGKCNVQFPFESFGRIMTQDSTCEQNNLFKKYDLCEKKKCGCLHRHCVSVYQVTVDIYIVPWHIMFSISAYEFNIAKLYICLHKVIEIRLTMRQVKICIMLL